MIALSCFRMELDRPISINLMGRIYDPLDEPGLAEVHSRWRGWLEHQADALAHDHSEETR